MVEEEKIASCSPVEAFEQIEMAEQLSVMEEVHVFPHEHDLSNVSLVPLPAPTQSKCVPQSSPSKEKRRTNESIPVEQMNLLIFQHLQNSPTRGARIGDDGFAGNVAAITQPSTGKPPQQIRAIDYVNTASSIKGKRGPLNRAASLVWNEQETSTGYNTNLTAKKEVETSNGGGSRRPSLSAVLDDAI